MHRESIVHLHDPQWRCEGGRYDWSGDPGVVRVGLGVQEMCRPVRRAGRRQVKVKVAGDVWEPLVVDFPERALGTVDN